MTNPASTEENRRIREAGTPGKWTCSDDDPSDVVIWDKFGEWLANVGGRKVDLVGVVDAETGEVEKIVSFDQEPANGRLIAHAVNQLIPLSEKCDRLEVENDELRSQVAQLEESDPDNCPNCTPRAWDALQQENEQLRADLATARKAMGPLGTPPLPKEGK